MSEQRYVIIPLDIGDVKIPRGMSKEDYDLLVDMVDMCEEKFLNSPEIKEGDVIDLESTSCHGIPCIYFDGKYTSNLLAYGDQGYQFYLHWPKSTECTEFVATIPSDLVDDFLGGDKVYLGAGRYVHKT